MIRRLEKKMKAHGTDLAGHYGGGLHPSDLPAQPRVRDRRGGAALLRQPLWPRGRGEMEGRQEEKSWSNLFVSFLIKLIMKLINIDHSKHLKYLKVSSISYE